MSTARPSPAVVATSVLAMTLAGVGAGLTLTVGTGRIIAEAPAAGPGVLFACFAVAFVFAESALVHVELRRQAYSFSLSGFALILGLMFCDVRLVVAARLLGALLVFCWQRLTPLKAAYNLAAYSLETALVGLSLHAVLGTGVKLTLAGGLVCCLVVALVDLLMSALVVLVITWNQGRITLRQGVRIVLPASGLGLFSTVAALTVIALLDDGSLGVTLVIVLVALGTLLYRGYLLQRRRHQSLALMHDFVRQGLGASSMPELAQALLGRTRTLLNAATVELLVYRDDADLRLRMTEDGFTLERAAPVGPTDELIAQGMQTGEPIAISQSTREPQLRAWLSERDACEAMLVPLPVGGLDGLLIVTDRLGDASTFTSDDLIMLQTLAGHIAVALREVQLVEQLRHDATHDALTGLANRALLTARIEHALIGPVPPVVLLFDLDRFKEVNDALGHHVGDALLQVVGDRIRHRMPAGATVARLGGDEFAVLVPGPDPKTSESDQRGPDQRGLESARASAHQWADVIVQALNSPVALHEATISTRASLGVAIGADRMTGADLLRHAGTAMYAAQAGKRPVVVYTEDLDRGRAERLTLLADLHLALERDELVLYYQPQLDLHHGRIVSVEALVRWQHLTRGLMGPDTFIPLAESSGLIEKLTYQVLGKALRQCRHWREAGLDLVVGVNLSAHNVTNPDLAENVAAALAEAGLPADRLVLEITESSVMDDPDRAVAILQRLADIGVRLSLDDFGTGYSSLSYLQRLPVTEVKIDKSFVMGMNASSQGRASAVLVRSILALGHNLGLRVVAEGVEDAEVLEVLRGLGCDVAQGFYLARPLPAADVAPFVAAYQTAHVVPAQAGPPVAGPRSRPAHLSDR